MILHAGSTADKVRIRQVNSRETGRNTHPGGREGAATFRLPLPAQKRGTESQSLIWEGCRQAPKTVSTVVLGDRTGRFTFAWENHTGKGGR
ncbi:MULTISPECIES: hypothetical protein [Bacteroides]|uniref:hypothetical protein n=1 Tax=Bacteroides TaxID=816 RepID=UPI001C409262|nr:MULTISPECIES: hypothetical protein [Bacteroides]MCE8777210.1 hypothetical protein [Bacteroides thetaiotaomicron]